jgi:RNA polymerase sigma-70 factor, ECF subfamily
MKEQVALASADEELVREFQRSHASECFEELWQNYSRLVFGWCVDIVHDASAAHDLTSDVCVKVLASIGKYQSHSFRGWVYRITKHVCIDYLKDRWNRGRHWAFDDDEDRMADVPGGEPSPEERALLSQIHDFINGLPDRQRVAVKLFYFEGFSYEQIANKTGESEGAVKSHLQNAIRKLRNRFGDLAGFDNNGGGE